jgi:hypothetical protein
MTDKNFDDSDLNSPHGVENGDRVFGDDSPAKSLSNPPLSRSVNSQNVQAGHDDGLSDFELVVSQAQLQDPSHDAAYDDIPRASNLDEEADPEFIEELASYEDSLPVSIVPESVSEADEFVDSATWDAPRIQSVDALLAQSPDDHVMASQSAASSLQPAANGQIDTEFASQLFSTLETKETNAKETNDQEMDSEEMFTDSMTVLDQLRSPEGPGLSLDESEVARKLADMDEVEFDRIRSESNAHEMTNDVLLENSLDAMNAIDNILNCVEVADLPVLGGETVGKNSCGETSVFNEVLQTPARIESLEGQRKPPRFARSGDADTGHKHQTVPVDVPETQDPEGSVEPPKTSPPTPVKNRSRNKKGTRVMDRPKIRANGKSPSSLFTQPTQTQESEKPSPRHRPSSSLLRPVKPKKAQNKPLQKYQGAIGATTSETAPGRIRRDALDEIFKRWQNIKRDKGDA